MNIQRIKALVWLGALAVGGLLAWVVTDFLQNKQELEKYVDKDTITSVLQDQVEEPEPPKDERVAVDDLNKVFHEMPWVARPEVRQTTTTTVQEEPKVLRTPVADLLRVLALNVDLEDGENSTAYVRFLDTELERLRREPKKQILHAGERLGGSHDGILVEAITVEGVRFTFDEEGREPEVVAAADFVSSGPGIVKVPEGQDPILPERTPIPGMRGDYQLRSKTTVPIRQNEFQIGSDEARDLGEHYPTILSRDVSYRQARDPKTGDVKGLQITKVSPNSLPARHGLEAGEVLKSINGHTVRSVNDAVAFVKQNAESTNTWEAVFEKQGVEFTRTYHSPVE